MDRFSLCSIREFINEKIHSEDANSPTSSVATVINYRRDVGYDRLNDVELSRLRSNGVGFIKVPRTDNLNYYIFYRNKEKALRLLSIAKKHNGMLSASNATEAVEIGKLLDYDERSIDTYVFKKFGVHTSKDGNIVLPEPNIDDMMDYD